jgi:hypothetical protein
MNRIIAFAAFLTFAGFVGILIIAVPSPDLIGVALLTVALVIWDLVTSSNRKD